MFIKWLTEGDLGLWSSTHVFTTSPIVLFYDIEVLPAAVSIVDGSLPPGLSLVTGSYQVSIVGTIATSTPAPVYDFTLRITAPDLTYADQRFVMQVATSPTPIWLSPGNVGVYSDTHSFNLEPLRLRFAAADPHGLRLINGSLPIGLAWAESGQEVVITGNPETVAARSRWPFTLRLTYPNSTVADRTFSMELYPTPVVPDWSAQPNDLGYVGAGMDARFRVKAQSTDSTPLTYQLLSPIPPGVSMASNSGEITYHAPVVSDDTTVEVHIRATQAGGSADITCGIRVLRLPHEPIWLTSNAVQTVPQGTWLELPLETFDPYGSKVNYSIYAADPGFPFTLDPDGLLWGQAPSVTADVRWEVVLLASSPYGGAYQYITFIVTKTNAPGVLRWRNPTTDILGVRDGRRATFDLGAISSRTPTVRHGIIGGMCPPGMLLDKIQGYLVGYVDYHAANKDYWFDVWASDGIDTVVRTIRMQVVAGDCYQSSSIAVPAWGDIKQRWLATNNYVLTNPDMHVNVAVESHMFSAPAMSLIKGLDAVEVYEEDLLASLQPQLQRLELAIGPIGNVVIDDHDNNLVYRTVKDPQDGAAATAQHKGLPPVVLPPSLVNLRRAFMRSCRWANGGLGDGAAADVLIDPEHGSIVSLPVISRGTGYSYAPQVIISGQGTGAAARAIMRLRNITVVDPGQHWQLGEELLLDWGDSDATPAQAVVTAVSGTDGLVSVLIYEQGCYRRIPHGKVTVANARGGVAMITMELELSFIDITQQGTGYVAGTTAVSLSGSEQLQPGQTTWQPWLPMAVVTPGLVNAVIYNSKGSPSWLLDGIAWQASDLVQGIEGIYWQGRTRFSNDGVSWDGGTTAFQETRSPRETIFDNDILSFDAADTTLDLGPAVRPDARDNWGRTLLDEGLTAFDLYATIFDGAHAPQASSTLITRRIPLHLPQISGNNVVDTR